MVRLPVPEGHATSTPAPLTANLPPLLDWNTFLASGAGVAPSIVDAAMDAIDASDVADILFTSGTTGSPKGVVCTHGQNTRSFREQIDDLVLDECGVDVHHDQALAAPIQPGMLDGHIDTQQGGSLGQLSSEVGDVLPGSLEDHRGDGVRGYAPDAIDIPSAIRHAASQLGHCARRQVGCHHGDVDSPALGILASDARSRNRLDLHTQASGFGVEDRASVSHGAGVQAEQDRENEASPYDDLLDVEDLARSVRKRIEE